MTAAQVCVLFAQVCGSLLKVLRPLNFPVRSYLQGVHALPGPLVEAVMIRIMPFPFARLAPDQPH